MTDQSAYTEYHPRWYRPRKSTYWWLERPTYLLFILRELSSVFVAWGVVFLLFLVRAVQHGEDAYKEFLTWSREPWVLVLNLVSLFFILFHAVTWFNLAPQAMVVHLGHKRVPGILIAGSNYAALVAVSAAILVLILMR